MMGNSGSASKCSGEGLSPIGLCLALLAILSDPNSCFMVDARSVALPPKLTGNHGNQYFRAAVYEHAPVLLAHGDPIQGLEPGSRDFDYALSVIASNLEVYYEQVQEAHSQGADIIVFPEYGLTGLGQSRETLRNMAEQVPDPRQNGSNPCKENHSGIKTLLNVMKSSAHMHQMKENNFIQWSLSCMAQEYEIYVVVNMPSWEPCDTSLDSECPEDNYYLYNTNVVYDDHGTLVGRYRKWTLYYENALNQPKEIEHDYFDTNFGRMGTFICFDVLFEKPAIDLVEELQIDTALFPTAWQSKLPLMQGVGFHESWAILNGVNLLGSELHLPIADFAGSGIYSGANGAVRYYYDKDILSSGKLLVSQIPIKPVRPNDIDLLTTPIIDEDFHIFESIMRGDLYSFVALDWDSHEIFIESENTSCYLNYSFSLKSHEEIYAFAVFQGLHYSAHNSYLQVCALVKCGDINDLDSCGDSVKDADSVFQSLTIHGQFSSKYVYPSMVVDGGVPTGNLSGWDFTLDSRNMRARIDVTELDRPLVYATLYGRIYERDIEDDEVRAEQNPKDDSGNVRFVSHASAVPGSMVLVLLCAALAILFVHIQPHPVQVFGRVQRLS